MGYSDKANYSRDMTTREHELGWMRTARRDVLYKHEDDQGNGFAVGVDGATVEQVIDAHVRSDEWKMLHSREHNNDIAVVWERKTRRFLLIGDKHGPWAVRVA